MRQPTLPLLAHYLLILVRKVTGPRLWTTQPHRWPRCGHCGEQLSRRVDGRRHRCGSQLAETAQPHSTNQSPGLRCLGCTSPIQAGQYCEPCRLRLLFGVPPQMLCARCRSSPVETPGAICDTCQMTFGRPIMVSFDPGFEPSFTGFAVVSFRIADPDDPVTNSESITGDTDDTDDTDEAEACDNFSRVEELLRDIYWTEERT